MELAGRRILVVGGGKTGAAAAAFLSARGAKVTLTDKRPASTLPELAGVPASMRLELGGHHRDSFLAAELILLSPGVPAIPELEAARAAGVPVTGEVELASHFIGAPMVAVTGTNGKSTVTALAGEMARRSGRPTFVGGNLGTPLITAVGSAAAGPEGLVVVEVSSFQLETCDRFHPRAAALLNLTPDHLDRYAGVEEYLAAKLRLARRMTPDDVLVVGDDAALLSAVGRAYPRLRPFVFGASARDRGGFLDGEELVLRLPSGEERYPATELELVGRHNRLNALAALLLVRAGNLVSPAAARAGLSAFRALPHRMERVGERGGVAFYDDSKATNVHSVVAGLDGFPTPYVLIAGGRDKGGSYQPLGEALARGRCRGAVLIGEAAGLIASALEGVLSPRHAASMQAAVAMAADLARPGDAVILSPACASFDMFDNYEHRGRVFRDAVHALEKAT